MRIPKVVKIYIVILFLILMDQSAAYAQQNFDISDIQNAGIQTTKNSVKIMALDSVGAGFKPTKAVDDGCDWRVYVADDFSQGVWQYNFNNAASEQGIAMALGDENRFEQSDGYEARLYSETGRWWTKTCPGEDFEIISEGEPVTVPGLLAMAIDEIKPGEPPTRSDPEGSMKLVQAPTILSIDPAYWTARSKTVSAGRVSVTATLDPYKSVWDSGEPDADSVVCSGPGKAYVARSDWKKYKCAHVYKWAPPPGEYYTMTTSAVFEITATSNTPETMGPYEDLAIESTEQVEVGELHALVKKS